MPRPAFCLTDDQARALADAVHELQACFPHMPAVSHRPFVRGFVAAVHEVTGSVYGAGTYRRLLQAYAPERTPSTSTLADEQRRLTEKLALAHRATPAAMESSASDLAHLIRLAVADALEASSATSAHYKLGRGAAEADFLRTRLEEAEARLREKHEQIRQVGVELDKVRGTAMLHSHEAEIVRKIAKEQAEAIAMLAAATGDARKFAMLAIDEARGEARMWKERCIALERQRQLDARLLETFRQAAYLAGAEIPDALRKDKAQ
jgi:hypothetical protein